jgi:hypothetical protein
MPQVVRVRRALAVLVFPALLLSACGSGPTLRGEAEAVLPGSIRILHGDRFQWNDVVFTVDDNYVCPEMFYIARGTAVILLTSKCKDAQGRSHSGMPSSLEMTAKEGRAHWRFGG